MNMGIKIIRFFAINMVGFLFSIFLTFLLFISSRQINPISIGILQYVVICLHFFGIFIFWFIAKPDLRDLQRARNILVSIAGLVLGIILYNIQQEKLWEYFWDLR